MLTLYFQLHSAWKDLRPAQALWRGWGRLQAVQRRRSAGPRLPCNRPVRRWLRVRQRVLIPSERVRVLEGQLLLQALHQVRKAWYVCRQRFAAPKSCRGECLIK